MNFHRRFGLLQSIPEDCKLIMFSKVAIVHSRRSLRDQKTRQNILREFLYSFTELLLSKFIRGSRFRVLKFLLQVLYRLASPILRQLSPLARK